MGRMGSWEKKHKIISADIWAEWGVTYGENGFVGDLIHLRATGTVSSGDGGCRSIASMANCAEERHLYLT